MYRQQSSFLSSVNLSLYSKATRLVRESLAFKSTEWQNHGLIHLKIELRFKTDVPHNQKYTKQKKKRKKALTFFHIYITFGATLHFSEINGKA